MVTVSASPLDLEELFDEMDHETRSFLNNLEKAQSKNPNQMDMACVSRHCALLLPAAMLDPNFYKESSCELGCNDFYYNSTDPGKLEYQNCTTKCALTYESPAMDKMMACAMNHECVTFAPIDVTCPVAALEAAVEPGSSLASLEGEWW